jgi:hypothetical protein
MAAEAPDYSRAAREGASANCELRVTDPDSMIAMPSAAGKPESLAERVVFLTQLDEQGWIHLLGKVTDRLARRPAVCTHGAVDMSACHLIFGTGRSAQIGSARRILLVRPERKMRHPDDVKSGVTRPSVAARAARHPGYQ